MNIETIKRMFDACYQAKRTRDMLPPLPKGVSSSYIQYLDVIQSLQQNGIHVKISDISDALDLPRPGVTRTIKEMEADGYLQKSASSDDGRITYISVTESGKALRRTYDTDFFSELAPFMDSISEEDADTTIRTIAAFYQIMLERREHYDKR